MEITEQLQKYNGVVMCKIKNARLLPESQTYSATVSARKVLGHH